MHTIRLTNEEIEHIKNTFLIFFNPSDKLWIFGSRIDPQRKGGDIDLYIETNFTDPDKITDAKLNFLVSLKEKIGDQKIDVVIKFGDYEMPIYDYARKEGIRLK